MLTTFSFPAVRPRPTVSSLGMIFGRKQLLDLVLQNIYKVKVASSGEQALHIAASDTPPDLILLDVMMPEMDGYEMGFGVGPL